MLAFCSMRFAVIRDCLSRVSMMIGVFGFGQGMVEDKVLVLEKMFSICFIIMCAVSLWLGFQNLFLFVGLRSAFFFLCGVRHSGMFRRGFF